MNTLRTIASLAAILAALATGPIVSAATSEPAPEPPAAPKRQPPVKKVELTSRAAAEEQRPKIAHIRLAGAVLAGPPEFSLFVGQKQGATLQDWLERLAKARNDERVAAVALEVGAAHMSWAQSQELADAVGRLRETKPVYAHLTSGGATPYLVASAANELTMDPAGTLYLTGVSAEMVFFRGALDWLGIRPQLIQIGRFKGAAEPFTQAGPSDELKGEYDKILDNLYAQLCDQVARQRKLTDPHVRQVIDEAPLPAARAQKYRLVDRLVTQSDWKQHVLSRRIGKAKGEPQWLEDYGQPSRAELDLSNPLKIFGMLFAGRPTQETREPTIAIIYANGMIAEGKSGEGLLGSSIVGARTIAQCFDQVAADKNVKAVIFRINSPGGSALASEMIYQAARKCGASKPVIASIAQVGASGGYYVALGAGKIMADGAALTGSVGVVSGKLAMTGLLNKIGITTHEFSRGRNAALWSTREWTQREVEVVRDLATVTYDLFVSRVKDSRGKRIKDIDSVVQGRIFTAPQAVANGMIDQIGGLREAVVAAQRAAKIEKSYILTLPRPRTLMDVLYGGQSSSATPMEVGEAETLGRLLAQAPALVGADARQRAAVTYLLNLVRMLGTRNVLAALPYYVDVSP